MRAFVVLMAILSLGVVVQVHAEISPKQPESDAGRPIANLPAPWEGRCFVATRDLNAALQAQGLRPQTEHECSISLKDRFDIVLTMPALGADRVPKLTISYSLTSGDAPVSLRFPDGTTFMTPVMHPQYDPENPMRLSRGWKGQEAQTILQRLMTAPLVQVRYVTATVAVTMGLEPAGVHDVTLSLAHIASAWKKLTNAIYALPTLSEEAPSRSIPPKTVKPRR
jgi:hypothetical protein